MAPADQTRTRLKLRTSPAGYVSARADRCDAYRRTAPEIREFLVL